MSLFGPKIKEYLREIISYALDLAGTSIGELIAKALDYADPLWGFKRNNKYIFN